jgi:DNA-binding CsgD family transcriptional regulator
LPDHLIGFIPTHANARWRGWERLMSTVRTGISAEAIAAVVSSLGTDRFEAETMRLLHDLSGVEHYTIYRMRDDQPQFLGGASIRGPHAFQEKPNKQKWPNRSFAELRAAQRAICSDANAVVVHEEIEQIEDPVLHSAFEHYKIVDRVMVCGKTAEDLYAVSALRSKDAGEFANEELQTLAESANVLIAVCAKHAALHWDKAKAATHFGSVEKIEGNLRQSDWGLSERELQVSARILFGISAYGIALDLGLGEETVATYRKRLYARLRIGGRHELLQRYLKLL